MHSKILALALCAFTLGYVANNKADAVDDWIANNITNKSLTPCQAKFFKRWFDAELKLLFLQTQNVQKDTADWKAADDEQYVAYQAIPVSYIEIQIDAKKAASKTDKQIGFQRLSDAVNDYAAQCTDNNNKFILSADEWVEKYITNKRLTPCQAEIFKTWFDAGLAEQQNKMAYSEFLAASQAAYKTSHMALSEFYWKMDNYVPYQLLSESKAIKDYAAQCEADRLGISEAEPVNNIINISGLNKVDVLEALFKAALPGSYWPSKEHLSRNDFEQALNVHNFNIDYLGGKPLKVDLRGNTFDAALYNRDNGEDAAQKAIAELRKQKTHSELSEL